ncbi:MAG: hypothetical protein ABFS14_00435 [Gemmatimonadota bacterium]
MGTRTMIHDLIAIGFAAIALVGGTLLSEAASAAEVQGAQPAVIAPDSGCPQMLLVEPAYLLRMDTLL